MPIASFTIHYPRVANTGTMAVPFQIIMGAVFSIGLVGVACLVGLLLRIPALGRVWYSSALPAVAMIVLALGVLFFDRSRDLRFTRDQHAISDTSSGGGLQRDLH